MRTVPVIAMQPVGQVGRSFARMAIHTPVSPLTQRGLDETFGFAIGARRVDLGEDVAQAPAPASRNKRQRTEHLGVVRHDAAYVHSQCGVVARCVVEERCRTPLALVVEHLDKRDPRAIVNGNESSFVAHAADMVARIAGDAVSGTLNARQLLAVDVQQLTGAGALITTRQRCRIERRQPVQSRSHQHPRHGGARDAQLSSDTTHGPASLPQCNNALGGTPRNGGGRAVWPRTAIAQTRLALRAVSQYPFTPALPVNVT